jgi:predicted DNA-binding protein (MmcQ/YjbR family)
MTNDAIRDHCLSLPHATEVVRWEDHLLFKVGGKMFGIIALDGHSCTFRCAPETYAGLLEMPDIVPASHNMWKYNWVTTETLTALPSEQFRDLLTASYRLVRSTLPERARALVSGARGSRARKGSSAGTRGRRPAKGRRSAKAVR